MPGCFDVPIIDVNKNNFLNIWPSLLFAVKSSTFIALDLELSGLGNRKQINAKSVEDRYKALSDVAKTHGVISFGVSCFSCKTHSGSCQNESSTQPLRFLVQTFNILVLCQETYMVEPEALKFLVGHGFDFNKQYATGLPYYRGNDREEHNDKLSLRTLFSEIITCRKPLILHNGLVDLIFLYQSFYCMLPNSLASFLADLDELHPEGVYDTKFIAENRASMQASYLEYVFRKRQRENADKEEKLKSHILVEFLPYNDASNLVYQHFDLRVKTSTPHPICKNYAHFGWCSKGPGCENSHNIDDILDMEGTGKKKKRLKETFEENGTKIISDNSFGCHRAGQDAFMTGFAFATFLAPHAAELTDGKKLELTELKNKIYLSGKNVPLLIMTSNFAKTSPAHQEKQKHFVRLKGSAPL